LAGLLAAPVGAQELGKAVAPATESPSLSHVVPTQEMWFYDQELRQRYSPALAVRRKAELETSQRMQRLAAREWYGIDVARPIASPTPFTSSYSPMWTSGSRDPFHWAGYGRRSAVIVPGPWPVYNGW